ncbi:TlpA family protein disulfide reductase [Rhodothermus bifroesti]|uniref:TlpA family protein disulfide reductase n=1 Tax=Rhodothermus bifroesti TaxID=2823335 RepID=UPI001AEF456C|nr:TlpA disulfide reductase family protein [Rhodothermus bifroesti]
MVYRAGLIAGLLLGMLLLGCRSQSEEIAVWSVLEGQLTVAAEVDPTPDYRGFEVLVYRLTEGLPDTLGLAITDSTGRFVMHIRASRPGIYPLRISRRGTVLATGSLVVAPGDSAQLRAVFPLQNRRLLVRSRENAAWLAYQNAIALHNQDLLRGLQAELDSQATAQVLERTLTLLHSVETTYPGTLGAQWAAAEAVRLLAGWAPTQALVRFDSLPPTNPRYTEVVHVLRRELARREGQAASVRWLEAIKARMPTRALRTSLQAELVLAYMDSLQDEAARAALEEVARMAPDSAWQAWVTRVRYELDHLRPGMEAPFFVVTTLDGRTLTLDGLRGSYVLLEFFWPEDPVYLNELAYRNALAVAYRKLPLNVLALSLEPDTLVNEAFYERFPQTGQAAILPQGRQDPLVQRYGITALPARWLIGPDGRLIGRFEGPGALVQLQQALARLQPFPPS